MTSPADYERVLAVIESAIDVARCNPRPGEAVNADDYVAWCILQELRRAGWKVVPS